MKSLFTIALTICFLHSSLAQLNMELLGQLSFPDEINDVWAWVDDEGNEYALVGLHTGVSIIDISNPEQPTELSFIPGQTSVWRDIKTWKNFAYVSNETGGGITVIDLSKLPNEVSSYEWAPFVPGLANIGPCHNIFIDEFGVAYLAGCNLNSGGLLYINVDTPSGEPEYIDKGPLTYSHDVYVRDNIAYSSEIFIGRFSIYDVSDKSNTVLLGRQSTAADFTHNAWPSDNNQFLFTTDERANSPISSFDISDVKDIVELDQFRPYETLGEGAIPHNVHVWNEYLIASYYTEGCLIIDASQPDNLIEVGYFDTWPGETGGFNGAWGAYPYLPSGNILVTDQTSGLFILEPTYSRAAYLEGAVVNSQDQSPIPNAEVKILATAVVEKTDFQGQFKTGYHTGNIFTLEASAPGFETNQVEVELINEEISNVLIELTPLPTYAISINVLDEITGAPIPNAKVHFFNSFFEYSAEANDQGELLFPNVLEDTYEVTIGQWGYISKYIASKEFNAVDNSATFVLAVGLEDNFNIDLGWEVSGDNFSGDWELAQPIGLYNPYVASYATPMADDPEDQGPHAYITDNGLDLLENSVSGQSTILTSPIFDLTTFNDPFISFSTWFLSAESPYIQLAGDDVMLINISNGDISLEFANISLTNWYAIEWKNHEFRLKDYFNTTANMQLTVTVGRSMSGFVEAGFDNFKVTEGGSSAIDKPLATKTLFSIHPNPSATQFAMQSQLDHFKNAELKIYNLLGQQVARYRLPDHQSEFQFGANLAPGVYLAQISCDDLLLQTQRLIKR